jgi:hypothetical protein
MCLPSTERAAARQRAAAQASGVQLVEKLPTPNKDKRIPVGVYQTIRKAVADEAEMRVLCERWAGNPVIDWYVYDPESADHTALFLACAIGKVETARLLISAGADVNRYYQGFTPLTFACAYMHLPIIRLLINEGADVNATLMGVTTPLDMVMRKIDECKYGDDPVPVPEDLLAIAELLKRAGGWRGGCLFCCISCLRF